MAPKAQPHESEIRTILESCVDPEVGVDIVHLGLVYQITCQPRKVDILMTLTTPGCPLAPYFTERIKELVQAKYPKYETSVTITFDPPWSPDKMSGQARAFLGR